MNLSKDFKLKNSLGTNGLINKEIIFLPRGNKFFAYIVYSFIEGFWRAVRKKLSPLAEGAKILQMYAVTLTF